jgi:hypothetical protein
LGGPQATNIWIGVTKTINPGLYVGGMFVEAGAVIDLTPGIYYVTDGNFLIASSATVTCQTCGSAGGVTIVMTTTSGSPEAIGKAQISPGATVTLQAPGAGLFSGLLFVQDPLAISAGDEPDNALDGGPSMNLTGLLYFPSTTLSFQGNPTAGCTVLIAQRIAVDGASRLAAWGCAADGLSVLPMIYTVALAE